MHADGSTCTRTEGTSKIDGVEQPTPVSDITQAWQVGASVHPPEPRESVEAAREEGEIFDINAQNIQLERRPDQERSVASGPWRPEERSTAERGLPVPAEGCREAPYSLRVKTPVKKRAAGTRA